MANAMVWANKTAKERTVTLHLFGGGLNVTTDLTPEAALELARELTVSVQALPRVVEASDLGLEAA